MRLGPSGIRYQIKARSIPRSKTLNGQRIGTIDLKKPWDAVLLVLMDETFQTTAIFEALRPPIEAALLMPGSKARNERGSLQVSKFKAIGRQVWPVP
jgi:hypothetical protein